MRNRSQPLVHEQPPEAEDQPRDPTLTLFADLVTVPGKYADTILNAGGFAFLAQLSHDNRLFVLRDHHLPTSLPARNLHRSICNATKLALSLCPLFPHGSEERATMRLFIHFLPQLLHAAGLRHQDVEYCCALFVQGKWQQLWDMAMARAQKLEAKQAKNPKVAGSRSSKEKSQYSHRCATAGNLSKACKMCVKNKFLHAMTTPFRNCRIFIPHDH